MLFREVRPHASAHEALRDFRLRAVAVADMVLPVETGSSETVDVLKMPHRCSLRVTGVVVT